MSSSSSTSSPPALAKRKSDELCHEPEEQELKRQCNEEPKRFAVLGVNEDAQVDYHFILPQAMFQDLQSLAELSPFNYDLMFKTMKRIKEGGDAVDEAEQLFVQLVSIFHHEMSFDAVSDHYSDNSWWSNNTEFQNKTKIFHEQAEHAADDIKYGIEHHPFTMTLFANSYN